MSFSIIIILLFVFRSTLDIPSSCGHHEPCLSGADLARQKLSRHLTLLVDFRVQIRKGPPTADFV